MKISLFGGIVEDYMKCSKATKPEESRLASDEAENIPYIFSVPEPIKLPAKQRDRGSKKIEGYKNNEFRIYKENEFKVPVLKDEEITTPIKFALDKPQFHIGTSF
mmetsp:Transcript_19895/g.23060  ORF Transcript_19895/g.23060 Transcript_19895/m.23060 type:complete len:105 (+) Transcript_19895:1217-1531(+)